MSVNVVGLFERVGIYTEPREVLELLNDGLDVLGYSSADWFINGDGYYIETINDSVPVGIYLYGKTIEIFSALKWGQLIHPDWGDFDEIIQQHKQLAFAFKSPHFLIYPDSSYQESLVRDVADDKAATLADSKKYLDDIGSFQAGQQGLLDRYLAENVRLENPLDYDHTKKRYVGYYYWHEKI